MLRDRIDVIAAILGAVAGAAISALNLIYSNAYMITIGPALFFICLFYLVFRRSLQSQPPEPQVSQRFLLITSTIFWLSLAASLYTLSIEALHRPPIYFILTSVCASIVGIQILYLPKKGMVWIILTEILLVSLSIRASAYWVFPTLPGSDPWAHLNYLKAYIAEGRIPEAIPFIATGEGYLSYPIMHLGTVATKLITATDYKEAMFLFNALPPMLSVLFVFLIGRQIINIKAALLATLLVSISDHHLLKGFEITGTNLGIAFFTAILFLSIIGRRTVKSESMILLLFATLILTHTMSAFVVAVLLLCLVIGRYVYNVLYGERLPGAVLAIPFVLFTVAMLAYWMYAGFGDERSFFEAVAGPLDDALTEKAGFFARAAGPEAKYGWLDPILNIAGFVILLAFGILGSLSWLAWKNKHLVKTTLITVLVIMFAILFGFPAFGVGKNFVPYRWFQFSYPVLAIAAAQGLLILTHWTGYRRIGSLLVLVATFTITFFMVTNNVTNMDSPIYAQALNQRTLYSDSEMAVAARVIEVYDGRIIADIQYGGRVLKTFLGRDRVSYDMTNEEIQNSGLVVWRDVMAQRPIQAPDLPVVLGEGYELKLAASHNLIYANNSSKAFLVRGQ